MILNTFTTPGLAHYSYAVGCEESKRVAIVDPRRDVDIYLEFAREHALTITHVLETHIHADYASGALQLAEQAGAELCLSAYDAKEKYEVTFPHRELSERDRVEIGPHHLEVVHTPGHTPEHISFLVFENRESKPSILFSGDFLFIGSLGRPDLLGEDATKELAHSLYESVRSKLNLLPDEVKVLPAHGAGSLCGGGMSGQESSTMGEERRSNPFLREGLSESDFVAEIIAQSPVRPDYYLRMKELNSKGVPFLEQLPGQAALSLDEFQRLMSSGALVIDVRDQVSFSRAHIPKSFGIGFGPTLAVWASWIIDYDTPLLFVLPDRSLMTEVSRMLVRVGLDNVAGYLEGGIETWHAAGLPSRKINELTPQALHELVSSHSAPDILDVRTEREWRAGHIENASNVACQLIEKKMDQISELEGGIACICEGGMRSTLAASLLERAGYEEIYNVIGGMQRWREARLPVAVS